MVIRRILLWGGGGIVGLGLLWILLTAFLARAQLQDLQYKISDVRYLVSEGRITDADSAAKAIPAMADRAQRLTAGPAWWTAEHIPYLGRPAEVARGTTSTVQALGDNAIPRLLAVARAIDPSALRLNGNTLRIDVLANAVPILDRAYSSVRASAALARRLPNNTWLSSVNNQRNVLVSQVKTILGYVEAADRAVKVLPRMLGADGLKRYFIALQNESETRGTGGLPGAFAIATAFHGKISFERFVSDDALLPQTPDHVIDTGLNFGADYDSLYGASMPTTTITDSNVSPNFPYAAQIWVAMWEKQYHEHIDGALAIDPTALAYFLQATGPTALPSGYVVTSSNIVALTERDNYALFTNNFQRKDFLVSILKAVADKITSGAGQPLALVAATSRAAAERRLLAWTADPTTERLLEQTTYAGALPRADRPFSAVILNNAAGGKLDYYLNRSIDYVRVGCGDQRDVLVTIGLTNDAPASGLPLYVRSRADTDAGTAKPGDNRLLVDYFATGGSSLQSVTLDGRPATASSGGELGLEVFRLDVELPRGQTRTIVLHLREPAGKGSLEQWIQPGVNTPQINTVTQACK